MIELFNLTHIIYLLITWVIMVGGLILAGKFIKTAKFKNLFLGLMAWVTFVLHISIMWVEFLQTGEAVAYDNILFPIYFCNFSMYLLLVVSLIKNKESRIFKFLAAFTAYAGIFGSLITTLYPDTYLGKPIFDWLVFKSMLSHTTMGIGCAYLFVGGFVKIRVKNLLPYAGGLLIAGLDGLIINGIFAACGLNSPNSMYLISPPISDVPFLNCYIIALLMLLIIFIFTFIWEFFAVKSKYDRWYYRLPAFFKSLKKPKPE